MPLCPCRCKAEEDRARFDARADELLRERDCTQQESEELKVQLSLSEDRVDQVQGQLQETLRKLKETENVSESLRKDLTDVRRQLSDCSFEKDKYCSTNRELREIVKRLEGDKREAARGLDEAVQKISMLEDARAALDVERARLQAQVRDLEHAHLTTQHNLQTVQDELARTQAANKQAADEGKELQARLAVETEERERASQELHQLRKQVGEWFQWTRPKPAPIPSELYCDAVLYTVGGGAGRCPGGSAPRDGQTTGTRRGGERAVARARAGAGDEA